ncbi:MAG: ribonuclease D [Proteobacteria bacterium]|jgi:ribonuclease D|nr:ribonuclease D [Alphaproteobacteria bacterium]NCC03717.1 ribonuclease D [Pseudomonadota bacterium]
MELITTTKDCAAFCRKLAKEPYITIDTEFMRERTYYAKLCLVQIAGAEQAAAIDPLAPDIDLTSLFDLLSNTKVLKVFHAARQDVEIFVNLTGKVPCPIYDTQVAAMVCGFGEAASYETLATTLAKAKIDKSSRFTDWSLRPLSERQLEYALADVTHLRIVYEKLKEKTETAGRTHWVDEEMDVLSSLSTYQVDPYDMWRKLKLRSSKPRHRAILREIVAWREIEAQHNNVPRSRIIKDDPLLEIASHAPQTTEALTRIRGLGSGFAEGRHGTALLEAIQRGMETPAEECPPDQAKKRNPRGTGAVLELLKVLLYQVAEQNDVAPRLIATSDDLERLAAEEEPDIKTLRGWRLELFGQTALALKKGELALTIQKNKIKSFLTKEGAKPSTSPRTTS